MYSATKELIELAAQKSRILMVGHLLQYHPVLNHLKRMIAEGHYLGPHSDSHTLYCSWEDRKKTLVSEEFFKTDLQKNIDDLRALGALQDRGRPVYFIPPYEWYNEDQARWSRELGVFLFNFTPGSGSNRDWAPEDHKSFAPSQNILEDILAYEQKKIAMHSCIFVRLPDRAEVISDQNDPGTPIERISWAHLQDHRKRRDDKYEIQGMPADYEGKTILSTVGRVILNDILPSEMPFYNYPLAQKGSARVIADCHALLGRRMTIDLLDRIKALGFRWSSLAGLSFGITDLQQQTHVPNTRRVIALAEYARDQGRLDRVERVRSATPHVERARQAFGDSVPRGGPTGRRPPRTSRPPGRTRRRRRTRRWVSGRRRAG